MKLTHTIAGVGAACAAAAFTALPAFAQAAPAAAPVVATVNKGDTAWMMTSTVLVMMMILPGLALFYGGLTRAKNMLSVMTQIGAVACLAMLIWVMYGYSLAFGPDVAGGGVLTNFIASFDKAFLKGVTAASQSATFTAGVEIPEYVFICFQMTFAAITVALVLGSVVERMKFSAVMAFGAVWLTIVYFPIAHMVWASSGLFFKAGALDFAGGTVVHINAGVSALVASLMLGKRMGYPNTPMPPHSLTLTGVGTGLLWVGWFGFNAGSALEANGSAGLAMINTFVATASGGLFWMLIERVRGHKGSALGFCSGIVAGLVAVTPAAGNSGPFGAIVLGAVASVVCFFAVSVLKPKLGYDDALDAFGVHGIGGMIGAIGTGIVYAPSLGGPGAADYAMGAKLLVQIEAVATTIVWASIGTVIAITIAKLLTGLRVSPEVEQEGLDLGEHGERAYN
ncbi:ammonia channel protein [Sphingomonas melonis TY]|jgi:ammonium transporter, Amt family|uniref:Ammonium transporter n=1 Tax=Sphingomonas melonis TY TaxID=621456 RepID=A0A175Y4K9_9SPHN|nr:MULTISPECIES: ammonium transporter [Sphingomonas]ANC86551.1 ammonia channel protein [Sphingomonas sp. NIC1]AOW22477.1 ammonia channel protein [Sphingomonas melonis TY]ATI55869.1 ammonium transporter [Sphingomonas melonis]KZB95607.1 ammonia channel protein [Sphingomonas melonis TY]MBI0530483.1 ammonium transporter [Sphingomonas sp. TX0522]